MNAQITFAGLALLDIAVILLLIKFSNKHETETNGRQATKEEIDDLFDESDIYHESKGFRDHCKAYSQN